MTLRSARANDIQAYVDSNPGCIKSKQKVTIAGKVEALDSYMLPISLLQYNRNNRRFALEILEKEANLKRKLDPAVAADIKTIKELLLQDAAEAKKLKDDLMKFGEQTEVAAITHDGIVINGNRRMATIEELDIDQPTGKWKDLWVVRLPQGISEKDLWKIEAGLQLSKDKVAEYGPVNDLLMIREGKTAKLTVDEIAASMYGWTPDEVSSALERLNLIDTFLQFINAPKNYGLIKNFRLSEHFVDIQKGILNKLKDEGVPMREINKKIELAFAILRITIVKPDLGISHLDVRRLAKVLQDEDATAKLTESIDPKKDLKKIPAETLIDGFDNAKEVLENKKEKNKPGKLLDKAITALKGIDIASRHFTKDTKVKPKVKELEKLMAAMKKSLGMR